MNVHLPRPQRHLYRHYFGSRRRVSRIQPRRAKWLPNHEITLLLRAIGALA